MQLWSIYYYYDHSLEVLPLANDGHLDFGLIQSMKALDLMYRAAEDYKKQMEPRGSSSSSDEGWVQSE